MRARIGLLAMAAITVVQTVVVYVFEALQAPIYAQMDRAAQGSDAHLWEQLDSLADTHLRVNMGLHVLLLVAIVLVASEMKAGRGSFAARLGAFSFAAFVLLGVPELTVGSRAPSFGSDVLVLLRETAFFCGLIAVVLAALSRLRSKAARIALGATYGALSALLVAWDSWQVLGVAWHDDALADALERPVQFVSDGADLVLVAASVWSAFSPPADEPAREPQADGNGLRLLAWTFLARVALGVVGAIAILVVSAQRSSVGGFVVLLTGLTCVCAAFVGIAIVKQLRGPEAARGGNALAVAIVALAMGAILDVWLAGKAVELMDLIAGTRWETSGLLLDDPADLDFSYASLSRIEELQPIITWGGGIAQVLGFVWIVALLTSFRRTARFLDWEEGQKRASTAIVLCIVAVVGAICTSAFPPPLNTLGGLAVLAAGIAFVVAFVRLALDLAGRMDERAEENASRADEIEDEADQPLTAHG